MPPKKNLSRGSLSNWCDVDADADADADTDADADADADISKTRRVGVDIIRANQAFFVYIWIISWDATNRSLIQH